MRAERAVREAHQKAFWRKVDGVVDSIATDPFWGWHIYEKLKAKASIVLLP